ncbi:MAG: J domain-containing protein [Clostridia bacterium]|nr:J domain-containing protein [Clostridia bacterium]
MTLYDKLEVSEKASGEVIEKAYKTLAKKYHPDLQHTPTEIKEAEEKMKEINEAYSILKNEAKRNEYDNKLQRERESKRVKQTYSASTTKPDEKKYTYGYGNTTQAQPKQQDTQNRQYQTNYQNYSNWQEKLASLSPKEREKLKRKIERDAREEYTRVAEDYYRQQGYRVIHKTTMREYMARLITIGIIILIGLLMWIIPFTHDWLVSIYENNQIIKILVNSIGNFFNALFKTQ